MGTFDIPEMSASESADFLKKRPDAKLLDVRTADEYRTARIAGATLVSDEANLKQILSLPRTTPLVVHCHHGMRSLSGAGYFIQQGFETVFSMSGGIDAWSQDVDPSIPRY